MKRIWDEAWLKYIYRVLDFAVCSWASDKKTNRHGLVKRRRTWRVSSQDDPRTADCTCAGCDLLIVDIASEGVLSRPLHQPNYLLIACKALICGHNVSASITPPTWITRDIAPAQLLLVFFSCHPLHFDQSCSDISFLQSASLIAAFCCHTAMK